MDKTQLKICIPSYKRSDIIKTLDYIPLMYKHNVYLYVRDSEYDEYHAKHGDKCTVIPLSNVSNIGQTRQAIIEHQYGNRIWMLDDDLSFTRMYVTEPNYRGDSFVRQHSKKMPKFCDSDFYELLDYINLLIDNGFYHGVVFTCGMARKGYNFPMSVNHYGGGATFLDLSVIPKSLIVYKDYAVLEDVAQWLNLLKNGYDSAKIYSFGVIDTSNASSNKRDKGGVYETRTAKASNDSANRLLQLYPDYISIRPTTTGVLEMIDGLDNERIRIQPKVNKTAHTERIRASVNPNYITKTPINTNNK
jgi:hypothetical protein